MDRWPRLDRRQFVVLVSALGLALGAGGVATGVLVISGGNPLLPGFRLDPDALRHIAERYFADHPAEKSAEFLESPFFFSPLAPPEVGLTSSFGKMAAMRAFKSLMPTSPARLVYSRVLRS